MNRNTEVNRITQVKSHLSLLAALLSISGMWLLYWHDELRRENTDLWLIGWVALGLLLAASMLAWLTTRDRRSPAMVRLDWFLPELRRIRVGQESDERLLGRWIRTVLPESWLSKHRTKQRGKIRRALRRLGNSWLASPLRRVVQSVCLTVFLASFFYVCWPYRARPLAAGQVSAGWYCDGIDQRSGRFIFRKETPEAWMEQTRLVFLRQDESADSVKMDISRVDPTTLELEPPEDLPVDWFDAILTDNREWTLYERPPDAWPSHYADEFAEHEKIPVDLFLAIDPLVSLSTAIASRSWVWSLTCAGAILLVCLLVPRGFCGYLCPLGTTIDLFDWAIGSRTDRFRVRSDGWWVHIKYYVLAGTLIAACMGVLLSGVVSAIPVITRALLFIGEPIQSGVVRGWHLVPGPNVGQYLSLLLFFAVLLLGFLRPRFWCKYVCPSGALFSLGNLFRVTERKVESSCIHCNKCIEICPFDAIKPDFTTRGTDCTMCQSCGGVCPTHAIKFVERWNVVELKVENDPPTGETFIGRRGFLSLAGGSVAAVAGGVTAASTVRVLGANLGDLDAYRPIRPPGSVPEEQFLQMCIRCGECFKVCPNNVLQPEGFEQGLEGVWTPRVEANWAGCDSSCNACGQVCPTGAIRALSLEEKRVARMGLAVVNESTCLPMAGREDCNLCVQECIAAGYKAIEYIQVGTEADENGVPIAGTGRLAPVVLKEKCVGCGLCQIRCYVINVKDRGVLSESAIVVEAGEGKEDRLASGSYRQLRLGEQSGKPNLMMDPPASKSPQTDWSTSSPVAVPATPSEAESSNPFGL